MIHFAKDETIQPYKLILEATGDELEFDASWQFEIIDEFKTINDITQELNRKIQLRSVYLDKIDCYEKANFTEPNDLKFLKITERHLYFKIKLLQEKLYLIDKYSIYGSIFIGDKKLY